jgi:hypothetical protein
VDSAVNYQLIEEESTGKWINYAGSCHLMAEESIGGMVIPPEIKFATGPDQVSLLFK